jgi:urease accessory protein
MAQAGVLKRGDADNGANHLAAVDGGAALQRSSGLGRLAFKQRAGSSVLCDLYQGGCLKIRLPDAGGGHREAVLINTAGGLTDGDRLDVEVHWRSGTAATVTTQACERIYRSRGACARIDTALTVDDGATAFWLPQETILFDGGALRRTARAELCGTARLVACEAVVAGRTAMGETVRSGALFDAWTVRRDGRLVFCDRVALDGDIQARLDRAAIAGGARAFATILYAGLDSDAICERLRPAIAAAPCTGGCTDLGGMMVARLVAPDGQRLRAALLRVLIPLKDQLGGGALPRAWTM